MSFEEVPGSWLPNDILIKVPTSFNGSKGVWFDDERGRERNVIGKPPLTQQKQHVTRHNPKPPTTKEERQKSDRISLQIYTLQ